MNKISQLQQDADSSPEEMEQRARALVEAHDHFGGRARLFEFEYCEDVLVVRGSVPTYYLKQILQSVLKDLDGVHRIDNQVTVAASDGILGARRD